MLTLLLKTLLLVASAGIESPRTIYVSPTGNDSWSGTLAEPNAGKTDGPFATLDAARIAVRKLPKAEGKPVTVSLRGGLYPLTDTVRVGPEDSGLPGAPVIYAAYQDETPVISGGVRIAGWKVGPDGRWQVTLPEVRDGTWNFSQLFVNGQRRYRPRLPKQGYFHVVDRLEPTPTNDPKKPAADDRFKFPPGSLTNGWVNLADVEVTTFHAWFTSHLRIKEIEPQNNGVTFTGRTRGTAEHIKFKKGMRFLVDNVAEALGEPGAWYLDRKTGVLTYIPMPGESPTDAEVIAPKVERLIILATPDKSEGTHVHDIQFRGVTFAHANWNLPPAGFGAPQAAIGVPASVEARHARNLQFVDCTFEHSGTYGLDLEADVQDSGVESCRFIDLGAGGVRIGSTRPPKDEKTATSRITVKENLFAHLDRVHPSGIGVWIGHADHCSVLHNDIFDLYYTGISVGWTWGYGPAAAHHNEIAWNRVQTIGQGVLSDMGGIYTLGASQGTTIHHNIFADIQRYDYGGWGIYFDEGTRDILAENNLCYATHDGGFHQHYGQDNTYRNNVLLDSRDVQFGPTRIDTPTAKGELREGLAFTFQNNIVRGWGADSVIRPAWTGNRLTKDHPEKFAVDRNVYWNGEKAIKFGGLTIDQWRAKGLDRESALSDPKFVGDPTTGLIELAPDSPALKLGFKPFDARAAGRTKKNAKELDLKGWPRAFPVPEDRK